MLVKIHPRGVSGEDAISYLLSMRDSDGQVRKTPPEVLRGNPQTTEDLIETSPHKNRYTSGVLSFEEHPDVVSQANQEAIMALFEKTALAGFEQDQVDILWVRHTDKDRLELNFLIPNQELDKGRFVNFYYDKADRPRFNAFQEYTNAHYGFSSPHDPEKARPALLSKDFRRGQKKEIIEGITEYIGSRISNKAIHNRDDVIRDIEEAGFSISRVGKTYITVKNPAEPDRRGVRLKGLFYGEDFTSIERLEAAHQERIASYQRDPGQRAQHFKSELEREIQARGSFIKKRYRVDERSLSLGGDLLPGRRQAENESETMVDVLQHHGNVHHDHFFDLPLGETSTDPHRQLEDRYSNVGSTTREPGVSNRELPGSRIHTNRASEPGRFGEANQNLDGEGEGQAHRNLRAYLQVTEEGALSDRSRKALSRSVGILDGSLRSPGETADGRFGRIFKAFESFRTRMADVAKRGKERIPTINEALESLGSSIEKWHQTLINVRTRTLSFINASRQYEQALEAQQREIEREEEAEKYRDQGLDWTM